MKTLKFLTIPLMVAISFIFTYCSKTEEPLKISDNQSVGVTNASIPANSSSRTNNCVNSFDYAGANHNEAIAFMEDKAVTNREDGFNQIKAFLEQKHNTKIIGEYADMNSLNPVLDGKSFSEVIDHLSKENKINKKQEMSLKQLNTVMENGQNEEQLLQSMTAFECGIINRKDMTDKEKEIILIGSAVGKYSIQYDWDNSENTSQRGGGCSGFGRKACIAAFDIGGAVIGVGAGFVASVGNPAGAVVGGVLVGAWASFYARCCICCKNSCAITVNCQ